MNICSYVRRQKNAGVFMFIDKKITPQIMWGFFILPDWQVQVYQETQIQYHPIVTCRLRSNHRPLVIFQDIQ